MKWKFEAPEAGDIVRVALGQIYHYGIYVSDGEVIQFGLPPVLRPADAEDVAVLSTDIGTFLCGKFLEVGKLGFAERRRARSRQEIVACARSKIGEKGYHILYNNCEHFVNECVFGEGRSAQVEQIRSAVRALPFAEVYIAPVSFGENSGAVYPEERRQEIESCKNERVRLCKRASWRLLAFAMKRACGIDLESSGVHREESGKWVCPGCWFSLSHTENYAAVAVAHCPVGVDIEEYPEGRMSEALYEKIANDAEKQRLGANVSPETVLRLWTAKESIFKREGGKCFDPKSIDTGREDFVTRRAAALPLYISVSAQGIKNFIAYRVGEDLSAEMIKTES